MQLIPRIFHRIWLGRSPMPREFVDFGNSWLACHPGWRMHTWTDRYAAPLVNYEAFHGSTAQSGRANVLRYAILLRFGGIYVDTDFECLKNLEPLLNHVSCFVALQSPHLANNAIIGCVAGHPFIRDLSEHVPAHIRALSRQLSIKQSGPYYLTERLQGRKDVTVFPSELFYPYEWHERWRRYEKFPKAYAVHHWCLSWRKRKTSTPCASSPNISVLIVHSMPDTLRLRWVLEGLCEQTAAGLFEVLMLNQTDDATVGQMAKSYANRIRVAHVFGRSLNAAQIKTILRACRGERIMLLDGRSVPDPQMVETHALIGSKPVVAFSRPRFYPSHKLFPFYPPLDYDALRMHSVQTRNGACLDSKWREIDTYCISLPKAALARCRFPSQTGIREGILWLARENTLRDHDFQFTPDQAGLTRLT